MNIAVKTLLLTLALLAGCKGTTIESSAPALASAQSIGELKIEKISIEIHQKCQKKILEAYDGLVKRYQLEGTGPDADFKRGVFFGSLFGSCVMSNGAGVILPGNESTKTNELCKDKLLKASDNILKQYRLTNENKAYKRGFIMGSAKGSCIASNGVSITLPDTNTFK